MLVFERNTVVTEDEQTVLAPSAIAHGVKDAAAIRGAENDRFSCSENLSHSRCSRR